MGKMKNKDYLTTSKPLPALTIFVIPLILGNLFQQFYNLVDSAIVGRYIGEQALAAVGACLAFTNVFIFIANGAGIGASVIVGRYFGAKEYSYMKIAIFTSFISFTIFSIFLGIFGLFCSRWVLQLLQTPEDVIDMATIYLNIYFVGLPFLFLYNTTASMFNAMGKSKFPLIFLILSSLLNIVLDILFVKTFHFGIAGAAWATLIAQGISFILSFTVFIYELKKLLIGKTKIYSKNELIRITKIALPSILQQSTISIGLMLVQSVVNSFGSQALAGYSVGLRIEAIGSAAMIAPGTALSTFTAQNYGAQKIKRIREGFISGNIIVLIAGIIFFTFIRLFKSNIISFFLSDSGSEIAWNTAIAYLNYMSIVLSILGIKLNSDGVLRGVGKMKVFTIASLVNIFLRVTFSKCFAPILGISAVWISNPVGWIVSFTMCYIAYKLWIKRHLSTNTTLENI